MLGRKRGMRGGKRGRKVIQRSRRAQRVMVSEGKRGKTWEEMGRGEIEGRGQG